MQNLAMQLNGLPVFFKKFVVAKVFVIKRCYFYFHIAPYRAQIKSSNIYGNNDFDSDFATVEVRNDFLKKCFAKIVGIEPYIEVSNHSHPRFLRIKGAKYECEIRPDAGVAWGWALDNRDKDNRGLRLRDCDESLDRDFALFNKRTYDGILCTVAWKKI